MKGGLKRDSRLRSLSLDIADLGVQFHCHLHLCALMLIYGIFASTLAA